MTAMPEEQVGRYSCPACPRRYHTLADKKLHIRLAHADTRKKPKR